VSAVAAPPIEEPGTPLNGAAPSANASLVCVEHYAALLSVIRARVAEPGISYELVDHFSGLTSGHFSKLVCDPPIKRMGSMTLFLVLEALGLRLVLADDPEARARTQRRYVKREKLHHMQRLRDAKKHSVHGSAVHRLMADLLKIRARRGGTNSRKYLPRREVKRLAQIAAAARWHKAREAADQPAAV
jgi:hypothetical protein